MAENLTPAQHSVWFTEWAGVAVGAYRMAVGIWYGRGLDEQALGEACAAVVARHRVLGSAVAEGPAGPVLVLAAEKITLAIDSNGEDRPWFLDRGPLARFTLRRVAPDRHLLLITAHHLVFDGESKDIIARDLARAYNAVVAGGPVELGLPVPHGDTQVDPARAREYWRTRYVAPGDVLLPGLLRTPTAAEPGSTVEAPLSPAAVRQTDEAVRRLGGTRFDLFLTAIHILLARYGNSGLPVTVALSTRSPEQAGEIGLFVNELPLTVAPPVGPVESYASDLRARLRELYRVRDVPLGLAVPGLRPSVSLAPVSVSYRRQAGEPTFTGVTTSVDWARHPRAATNALSMFIVDGPDRPTVTLRYSPGTIPADAVGRIAAHGHTVRMAGPARRGIRRSRPRRSRGWRSTAGSARPRAAIAGLPTVQCVRSDRDHHLVHHR